MKPPSGLQRLEEPLAAHPSPEASLPAAATLAARRPGRAAAWMLLASALFALMGLFARLSAGQVPWPEIAFARSFFGFLVAVGVARARGLPLAVQDKKRAWGRSACGTASMLCTFYVYASPGLPLGDAAALHSTAPVFIALLAPLVLGERSGRWVTAAVLVAFGGVLVLVRPQMAIAPHLAFVATGGAFMSALAMLFLRRLGPTESPEAVATHFSAVASLTTLALSLLHLRWPAPSDVPWLVATGVSAGLGQLAMTRAYALDHAARVGAIGYSGVVMTHLLAMIFLAERPGLEQLFGALLVVGAGLLLLGRRSAPRAELSSSSLSRRP